MPGIPWTAKERQQLGEMIAAGASCRAAGERLGRSQRAASAMAQRSGFLKGQAAAVAARRKKVRKLHARGLCTRHIATRLGVNSKQIDIDLMRLGLAPNVMSKQEQGRRNYRRIKANHHKTLGEFGEERRRVGSFIEGWPATHPGNARYLAALYDHAPLTASEMAAAVGACKAAGHYAALRLRKAGWIVAVARRKYHADAYDLAPEVRERRRETLAYRAARDLINCPRVGGEYTGGVVTDPNPGRRRR